MTPRAWTYVATILALGCAAVAHAQEAVSPAEQGRPASANQCIFFRTLYDWKPINDTNLVLWATRTQPFHLNLTPTCTGLRFATVIGFSSHAGQLCTLDSVILDNGLGRAERCAIEGVVKLDDAALQDLLAQTPGYDPRKKPAPEVPQ